MNIILGIDAGGTYTDSVLYDRGNQELIDKNKALTTYYNLTEGINNTITGLKEEWFDTVELVTLSTTLATNAIVEGRGGRVGLLLLGYDQQLMEQFTLDEEIPGKKREIIKGRFNTRGEKIESLDEEEIEKIIKKWQGSIDAVAISGYMSPRNPAHELKAKGILAEMTDLPVVCGHELTNKLNSIQRATTVALNASLIPMIKELNQKVKEVLQVNGIEAPVMMVKGDGSLVSSQAVIDKPIETVLSGPAASTIGAKHLGEVNEGVIVDIGGTTTDISVIKDGYPDLNSDGAVVGGWLSSIEAIKFKTIGLGGDSRIYFNQDGELKIGPKRVIPYSAAAVEHREVLTDLHRMSEEKVSGARREFLTLNRAGVDIEFNKQEEQIINVLETGPKSIAQIVESIGLVSHRILDLERLERLGVIKRIGLTPTDVLHVLGEYTIWEEEAAELGLELLMKRMKSDKLTLAEKLKERVINKEAKEIIAYLISQDYEDYNQNRCGLCERLIESCLTEETKNFLLDFKSQLPIVALGAPAEAYMSNLDDYLETDIIVPENYEVANAVGTAVGRILIKQEVEIKVRGNDYIVHAPGRKKEFIDLEEAVEWAKQKGKKAAVKEAKTAGAKSIEVEIEVERRKADISAQGSKMLLGIGVKIIVTGLPF
ncbi:hydantoinase/oxoprolinase N-terminal domain-containing protein [Acetohalobium arabaticum]|uniref:Hydantoinase/oxoprolinase n=1 Tax=Acetohalobium arabaticum (strain ATCC 49924 / DSM 5501 / Z-7288) TaxID=574087 RepID=D9QUB2_ACEAZ|nr:hydantoinase/oxoprolinase family protein [Acetohalobium arabaticum]ADL11905.1 Hydantoinase/oxoprolinase [Acetohalobium arabaticum DSM 5501]